MTKTYNEMKEHYLYNGVLYRVEFKGNIPNEDMNRPIIEIVDDYQYTEADNPPLPITPEEQELIDQRFLDEETIDDDNSEEYSDEGVVTVGPFSYTDDELLKLNLAEEIRSGVKDDESKEYLYAQLRAVQD